MAQYSEDGKVIVPPPGMKVRVTDWDRIVAEAEGREGRFYDQAVYEFGGGAAEFFEEIKTEQKPETTIRKRR